MSKAWVHDRGAEYSGLRWRVVWMDPTTRKEKSKSFKKLKGSGGADEYRTKIEDSMRSGVYLDPKHAAMSFREASEKYRAAQHRAKVGTISVREREFASRVLPQWGERPLGSIQRADVEDWVRALLAGTAAADFKRKVTARPLSASSVKHLVQHVSAVYTYAQAQGWVARNPARGVELPKPVKRRQRYLTPAQVELLAASGGTHADDSNRVLLLVLAYCGLRIGEALALQVGDLDASARRLHVERTWADAHGVQVLDSPKNGKARQVPVHGFLLADLVALAEDREAADFLFRAPRGGAWSTHNWRARIWPKALAGAGLQDMTPHDLRHTAASLAIASGADVLVVQTMLGHSSATETLDTYGHLFPDRLDEVADAMERARERALARQPDAA